MPRTINTTIYDHTAQQWTPVRMVIEDDCVYCGDTGRDDEGEYCVCAAGEEARENDDERADHYYEW